MARVVDHLEQYLGEIEAGWSADADGRPVPFQVVRCPVPELAGCAAFSTLGLSAHPLTSRGSGRDVRLELVMLCHDTWRSGPAPSVLQQIGRELIASGSALLRGDVVGPRGALVEGSTLTALYVAIPVHLPDAFAQCDDVVFAWLAPISEREARHVHREGWSDFERLLIETDPDLTDWHRSSILR